MLAGRTFSLSLVFLSELAFSLILILVIYRRHEIEAPCLKEKILD